MRRTIFSTLLICLGAAVAACNNSPSGSDGGNGNDAGGNPTDGGADGGGGTITTVSSMNMLPAPYTSNKASDFDPTSDGGAAPYASGLVEYIGTTGMSQGQMADGGGCPAALAYMTYCDGFQVNTTGGGGGSFLVDTYYYGGDPTACASLDNGATLPSARGVWYDDSGAFTVAITACSDLGMGTAYAGTGTPGAVPAGSQTVASLLASHPAQGQKVTVTGVVVGVHNGGDTFTAAIEDPNGGPNTSTSVYKGDTSASTATVPAVGDYITATGTWNSSYMQVSL